jgi:tetratricopeptide (TPR) repeat protein
MKKDAKLFPESMRILERANALNAKDFDVLVALGNAHFDLGFAEKSISEFQKARDTYSKALALQPDENVQTDLGISYVVQDPPAHDKGATQLQKVLDSNPKNERALLYLVKAFVGQNKITDAEKTLAKLKSVDPDNQSISELTSLISDAQTGAKK